MDRQVIADLAGEYVKTAKENRIAEEVALCPRVVNMRIFDQPLFAFGAADDPLFYDLKEAGAVGEHHFLPVDWLPQAKTVISFFLPFTNVVKQSNYEDLFTPSPEWLHARIEGHMFINQLCRYLQEQLEKAGYQTVVPTLDRRFWKRSDKTDNFFSSNWSERHVGYVCGLGTFGLSKAIITEKGTAGRIGSLVTELRVEPDKRKYKELYEYCTMCGSCTKRCPVNAISLENGKDHIPCYGFLQNTGIRYQPRYGCGKCQVKVPCENRIPPRINK